MTRSSRPGEFEGPASEGDFLARALSAFRGELGPDAAAGEAPRSDVAALLGALPDSSDGESPDSVMRRLAQRVRPHERYRRAGEIDRGGQATVRLVWDEDLQRPLAMKTMYGRCAASGESDASRVALARFLDEARLTGRLDHPGIVPVHELGLDEDGRAYFTMKLVEGEDLRSALEKARGGREGWTVARALAVLLRVCEATAFAHSKGVVHRDLKPSNVMIGRFGEVYVLDWGVARADVHDSGRSGEAAGERERRTSAESPLRTRDGQLVGTPCYMAPEQMRGERDSLGPHTDVYAVGAMLYHLFAGHPPYAPPGAESSHASIVERARLGPPEALLARAPDVPAELLAVTERAMAREPAARYADMTSLADDLRAYMEHRVVKAYAAGPWVELAKWLRRNRTLAIGLGSGLLALVAGLVTSVVFERRADAHAARAEVAERAERARADDVLALSTTKDVAALRARADVLWPPEPARISEYEAWLRDARVLLDGRAADPERGDAARPSLVQHRAALAELDARARPETDAGRLADAQRHPRRAELDALRDELGWHARMLGLAPWPDPERAASELAEEEGLREATELSERAWELVDPAAPEHGMESAAFGLVQRAVGLEIEPSQRGAVLDTLAWASFRVGRFEEALEASKEAVSESGAAEHAESARALEAAVASWRGARLAERRAQHDALAFDVRVLAAIVGERRFERLEDAWRHELLAGLVAELEALRDPDSGPTGDAVRPQFGWGVGRRLAFAREIAARSVEGEPARAAWSDARAAIAASARYGGLELAPVLGLLPLGADPASGLWEFAHLQSGEPARRGGDGALARDEGTGIVLVLIPGGSFWMGEQDEDPAAPNHVEESDDHPVHRVELSPFFLSKYEMTQAQWLRATGHNPSRYRPDTSHCDSLLHPVEHVSWHDATRELARLGLVLPSEAQWEYAARAGTSTPWWTGAERDSLVGAANLADRAAARAGATWSEIAEWPELDDGWPVHAPVGTFRPNPFGLHETAGNVFEWCLDGFDLDAHLRNPARDPVRSVEKRPFRVYRGASFVSRASYARSGFRMNYAPELSAPYLGLRPARGIGP